MNKGNFNLGIKRRKIEDDIIEQFREVDFSKKQHGYLEDDAFWDYIFAWHSLVKYYEDSDDTAIGQNMLQLYTECVDFFQKAMEDKRIRERRRDRAANAIYQLNYYLSQIMLQAQKNARPDDYDNPIGQINW